MQLTLRLMWPITSLAILPLLFPPLETAYVSSRYLLDEVGCFHIDVANSSHGNYTMYNNPLHKLDLAIDTCKKNLEIYIGIGSNTRPIDVDYFMICGGNELINKSNEMDASDCQPCNLDHPLLCGGVVGVSVYKIRDRPKTTENESFVPLYVAVTLILIVVIILDTYFYRRCKTGRTRSTLSGYEPQEADMIRSQYRPQPC